MPLSPGASLSCWNMEFDGVTTRRYESIKEQSIQGVVSYSGDVILRGVKVCGGGSCTVASYGEMHKGDSAEFLLRVPHLTRVTLTVDCSTLESRWRAFAHVSFPLRSCRPHHGATEHGA